MEEKVEPIPGGTRTHRKLETPYGELTQIEDKKGSVHSVKEWLETKEDYKKAVWATQQDIEFDKDKVIEEGRALRAAIGDWGPLGTYWGPPLINLQNRNNLFYHMFEYPEEFNELFAVTTESNITKLEAIREAGFDFLFYCVDGTDWISPQVFETYFMETPAVYLISGIKWAALSSGIPADM